MIIKDLGAVSAYAYAVEKGYTGTEAEFATLMASYATVAEEAAESAESASASATSASTSATTATTKASEATTAAQTATAKAEEAQADADAAALDASQALSAASTATSKASEAAQSASDAVTAKTAAQTAQTAAEGSATTAQTAAQTATTKAAEAAESARTLTIDPTLTQSGQAADAKKTGDKITSLKSSLTALTNVVVGSNLIDKIKAVTGALVNKSGYIDTSGSYSTYLTSDYIPVEAGKTYTIYLANSTGLANNTTRLIYVLFDQEGAGQSFVNQTGITALSVTPPVSGYIRVSATNTNQYPYFNDYLMVIEGTVYIGYEPYYKNVYLSDTVNPVNSILNGLFDKFNVLKNKKWVHCGDSFSNYTNADFTSGIFTGKEKTFPRLIAERNNMTLLESFMMSGRTLAYPSDGTFSNSLTCPTINGYYQNIPEDADYVTIMLGINDCQHTGSGSTGDGEDATGVITLGTIDDTTTATYYGAYNTVLGWLRQNRPFAHVGIIVTNGTIRQDYTEAQIAIAKKWGYPTINLNGDDKTPAMIRCYNPNLSNSLRELIKQKQAVDYDGSQTGSVNTHPNWQTHEYESTFIENFLRSI